MSTKEKVSEKEVTLNDSSHENEIVLYNDDVNRFSGDILYIENRAAVARTASQTEDIKVIITL